MRKIKFLLILYINCFIHLSFVEHNTLVPFQNNFIDIASHTSYSNRLVEDIAVDKYGYVWFVSYSSCSRFNGESFEDCARYGTVQGVEPNRIFAINCEDSVAVLFGAYNGLFKFDRHTKKLQQCEVLQNHKIYTILRHSKSKYWITSNEGVYIYDLEKNVLNPIDLSNVLTANFKRNNLRLYGYLSPFGEYLVGGYNFYLEWDAIDQKFIRCDLPRIDTFKDSHLRAILQHKTDRNLLYLGTEQGLMLYNRSDKSFKLLLKCDRVNDIIYDKDGRMWVGSSIGLHCFDQNSNILASYEHSSGNAKSLSDNLVHSLSIDKNNNLWIGTERGVSLLPLDNNFTHMFLKDVTGKETTNKLSEILKDDRGNIIVAGDNGVLIFNQKGSFVQLSSREEINHRLNSNSISDICLDSSGDILWMSAYLGLQSYNFKTDRVKTYNIVGDDVSYNSNWLYKTQEHDGKLYLSTYDNGLYVVDKQKLINSVEGSNISADYQYNAKSVKYNIDANLSVPYVYFSSRQTMWVYGEDYGVVKINSNNPSERVVYTKDIGNISSNNILSLSRYRENDVLVVSDSGLGVIHGANGAYEDLKIERLDSVITKVYAANDNELWIRSTTEWVEIDLLTNKIVERFPSKYGDIAFTNIYHDKSNDKIYYCSLDSYGEINHNNIIENQHAANDIAIVGLRLFDELIVPGKEYSEYVVLPKAIEYLDHIVLPYDLNTFTLEYAAVNASLVNKSAYRYRLLGFDDHWSENSNDSHSAKFHNVPPGEYQFQVISGLYGDSVVKTMQVTIRSPWYKNRIAYMLYWLVVLSLCVVIGVVVVREQNRKLDEISRRRSIDYSNMKLNFMSNIFKQINAPLSNIFEECYDNEKIVSNINIIKKTVALFVDVASASDDEKTIDYNREKIENLAELNVKNGSHENLPSSSEAKLYVLLCESVESHISDVGLNVAMLSKVNGLSSKKIYYLFKNYAYLTPIDYIRKVRLKKAAELLCKGGFSVSEVLYIVGFSSHSYFTKCFKAEFGLNPKEYAKKHNVKIDDEKF